MANVIRCPVQGYVPKLRQYNLPASLHTFGFGFSLKSGLLKSIAEIGQGNYAFIPVSTWNCRKLRAVANLAQDAGMIVCNRFDGFAQIANNIGNCLYPCNRKSSVHVFHLNQFELDNDWKHHLDRNNGSLREVKGSKDG